MISKGALMLSKLPRLEESGSEDYSLQGDTALRTHTLEDNAGARVVSKGFVRDG